MGSGRSCLHEIQKPRAWRKDGHFFGSRLVLGVGYQAGKCLTARIEDHVKSRLGKRQPVSTSSLYAISMHKISG